MEINNNFSWLELLFLLGGLILWFQAFFAILKKERKLRNPWSYYSGIDYFIFQIMGKRDLKGKKAIMAGIIYFVIGFVFILIAYRIFQLTQ